MDQNSVLTEPAKLLLLAALLVKDNIISCNAKAFLKELILRRDTRLIALLQRFESKETGDTTFLDQIHDLIEDESFAVYCEIFSDTGLEVGKTLSKGERDDKDLNHEKSLIYGEVDYSSFYRVLRKINPAAGGTFYDLGSGTGKAVIAARLACDFARCVGIEILESLHNQSLMIMRRYIDSYQDILSAGMHQMAAVFEGSFLDYDWSDGDVVFANSTCFDEKLMSEMANMARSLKPGAFFVTFTKGLNIPDAFEVIERKRYRMSWGPATVFIHRRLGRDGRPVSTFKLNLLPSDEVSFSDDEGNDLRNEWRDGGDDNDDDEVSTDEGDEEEDDDDEDEEEEYEEYLRNRAKLYQDDDIDEDDDSDSDDSSDDSDYDAGGPERDYEEYTRHQYYGGGATYQDEELDNDDDYSEEEEEDGSYEDEEDSEHSSDDIGQEEFYRVMESLQVQPTASGNSASRGSSKSTPSSSKSTPSSSKSTPSSHISESGAKFTPPRSSPSQTLATPTSDHSGTSRVSPASGFGGGKQTPPPLKVNVPSHLQQQSFQESIGSPQDAALLRKKNRSQVASRNKVIGAGY